MASAMRVVVVVVGVAAVFLVVAVFMVGVTGLG
jgi:hypothetical protein